MNSVSVPLSCIDAELELLFTTFKPLWVLHDRIFWFRVSKLLNVIGSKTRVLLSLIFTSSNEDIWPSVKALSVIDKFSAVSVNVTFPPPQKSLCLVTPINGILNAWIALSEISLLLVQ